MERMTKNEKRVLFLRLISKLILFAEKQGIELACFYFHRTIQEQRKFFRSGKSKTLNSKHLYWCAMDLMVLRHSRTASGTVKRIAVWESAAYAKLGPYWESLHPRCRWGGRWKDPHDPYHFEVK